MKSSPLRVAAIIFPGFEVLDLFGPVELLSMPADAFSIITVAERAGAVESAQGPRVVAERALSSSADYDVVLVPGGVGTRQEVANAALLDWLRKAETSAHIVASVCTASALLARAGMLDGRRATSNKIAFDWVKDQGPGVHWVRKARWVEDGKFFTSSGVSAGMDMTLAMIARLLGRTAAEDAAQRAEYLWHDDPASDPFAGEDGRHP
jgi:putative intracellular protease/amidase